MHRLVLFVFFLFSSLMVLLGPAEASEPQSRAAAPQKARVHIAKIRLLPDPGISEVVGTVQAVHQAVIASRIAGTIVELPVTLGSRVNEGDLLAKLDAREIEARLRQAQAQLAQAQRNLAREEKLLKRHASTAETVKAMRDAVAIAKAGYEEAKSMMEYTTIAAPFGGVITQKLVNRGDLATPGRPLLHLEDDTNLEVVAALPESVGLTTHVGDEMEIRFPTAGIQLRGTVRELSPMVDPRTRTLTVKIGIGHQSPLRTGMFARVLLPVGKRQLTAVPQRALHQSGQLTKVFVARDGRAWLRLVRIGRQLPDGHTEVLSGLRPDDLIIIDSDQPLINGLAVQPTQ